MKTVLLLDQYDVNGRNLEYSLREAGIEAETIVIRYDGFLPKHVLSPYQSVLESEADLRPEEEKTPLYFNQLRVPPYWEIRGTGSGGSVMNYETQRAKIFYAEPKQKRYIRVVDWLDESGKTRFSDHYDRKGRRFAQTVVSEGKPVLRNYFGASGHEMMTENFVSGTVMVRERGKEITYSSRGAFAASFLEKIRPDRILYASLGLSYAAAKLYRRNHAGSGMGEDDILFWQEAIRDTIPGNMVQIFNDSSRQTAKICVQTADAYRKLCVKVKDAQKYGKDIRDRERAAKMLTPLGYIYPFTRTDAAIRDVLVMTNSDRIPGLAECVRDFPELTFHVAAVTEMSSKLLALSENPNVRLYQGISGVKAEILFQKCGCLLDINEGSEILDAVHRSFLSNMLILGYQETAHNRDYTCGEFLFAKNSEGLKKLEKVLREALTDEKRRKELISRQRKHAMAETAERYREVV